jgi:CheY-like chemotaxis protein
MARLATEKAAEVSRLLLVYLGQHSGTGEPIFLAECCRRSLPLLQQALPSGVTLETACPTPGPVIHANADAIQQVLTHLLTNAWEALGATGGRLRLSLTTLPAAAMPTAHRFPIGWQPQGAEYACLEVMDTGCGIAEADLEKLFDPFFSTKFIGRGLGLPVVLGIVQAQGGALTVESQPGQGSVFRVYWPVSTEAVPSRPEPAVQTAKSEGGGTILLVDDDDFLRMSTGALIEMLGFTVLTAEDGIEAVEMFRQHQAAIRLVLTDLTMPRLDGWATLTALRQLDPNLPVILASGYDKAQVMASPHPDRPQAFLGKPFSLQELRTAVAQALAVSG